MKYKLFYPLIFFPLLAVLVVSCNSNNRNYTKETTQIISKINHCLDQLQLDSLSMEQKLGSLHQSEVWANKTAIDSLILKTAKKKAEFYNYYNLDSTFRVLKDFEKLANSKKDSLHIAHSLLNFGEHYYYNLNKKDSALVFFNKSNSAFINCKDSSNTVYSLLMMSAVLKEKSDYYDMEAVNTEALKYISPRDKNYKLNYSCVYNNLGIALKQNLDFKKALYFYKKARQYAAQDSTKTSIDNNIAALYTLDNKPKIGLAILLQLDERKNLKTKGQILNNTGVAYLKLKDRKSLAFFLEALAVMKSAKDSYGLMDSYAHLSNYYKTTSTPIAKNYAQKSYNEARKINDTEGRLAALKTLATTSQGSEAYNYLNTYFRLNDSMAAVKQHNKNQFAKIKYDFSIQLEQNQKLKTQEAEKNLKLAKSENRILVLLLLGVLSIGGAFIRFNYLKQKSKKEILQEGYNTETRISKQLHDELANDVYHTMTFAETQNLVDATNKETLLNNLNAIYQRTRNISKENSTIDTGASFVSHLKEMIADFSGRDVKVLLNGIESIPFLTIENNKKIIVYRVLQELLVNMNKHSQCSIVVISFKKSAHSIQINYSDNGIGIAADKIFLKNGLQNVENRMESIKGTINFETISGKGFKASLSIPI